MIDPTFMGAIEWTDRMAQLLPAIVPVKLAHPDDWRIWARNVCQSVSISRFNPPNPDNFGDWREWAYRFNNSVNLS